MKIAIDLTSFGKDFRGGKEQVVCNLLLGFSRISPETGLLLFCYEDFVEKAKGLAPGAEFIVFKRKKINKFAQDIYIRTFLIKKHLKDTDILFFPIYYTGFAKFKIPSVVLPHDIHFKSEPAHFDKFTKIKDGILYYLDFFLRDRIIAISDYDYNEMKEHYPSFSGKLEKIYNPITADETADESKRGYFLSVNVGFAHKNITTLIKAYKLIEKHCDIPLYLVGPSYDDVRIEQIIAENGLQDKVRHLGFVENDKLGQLIADAFAYVTPSTYEGFGMTAVEAMLHNVPVISSRQEALVEVTFGKARYYEPYYDERALADRMTELIDDYPDRTYLNDMRNRALSLFHYEKISGEYLEFFNRLNNCVMFADPMSYHNLALYDHNLLSNIKGLQIIYLGNENYDLPEDHGIDRIYGYSKYSNNLFKMLSYVRSQMKLYRCAKRHHVKVMHLQWSRMALFDHMLIRRMKRVLEVGFVYTSHDTFTHNFESSKKGSFVKLMGLADKIIVHTSKSQEVLAAHGFTDVEVINHGLLDIRAIYPPEPVDFEKGEKVVFSLLGYMEPYKGTDILLKAWLSSEKLMSMERMQLVVIGKNRMDYTPDIPHGGNIYFEDILLSDGAFTRWMELSDVVVLPYQSISQSGLMLTALSMNKLFIVNDIGEIAHPVKKYNLGWVINESMAEGLRIQLERIADDIAANGLPAVDDDIIGRLNEDYSWETAGEKTGGIYRELIEGDQASEV